MWQTIGGLLAAILALLLAGGGLLVLVWLLWKLWGHREEEAVPPDRGAELTATPAEPVTAGRGTAEPEVEVRPPAIELGLEAPDVAEAAPAAIVAAVEEPAQEIQAPTAQMETKTPAIPVAPMPAGPDDLTQIEGIGPKISSVLQAAGITTFADLATAETGRLREILTAADPRLLRLADPATWPSQAGLAAAGDWDGLQALQGRLSGGREV